mgnify:CR=1 FL=1
MQQKIRKIFLSVLPFFAVFIPILLGVPQSAQALERRRLIPVGRTVGVTMDTEGLLVLETGSVVGADNESHEPSKGLLKAGDRILQANGEKQENKEAFMKTIQQSEETDLSASGAKRQAEGGEDYTGSKQYRADLSDWRMDSGQYPRHRHSDVL